MSVRKPCEHYSEFDVYSMIVGASSMYTTLALLAIEVITSPPG